MHLDIQPALDFCDIPNSLEDIYGIAERLSPYLLIREDNEGEVFVTIETDPASCDGKWAHTVSFDNLTIGEIQRKLDAAVEEMKDEDDLSIAELASRINRFNWFNGSMIFLTPEYHFDCDSIALSLTVDMEKMLMDPGQHSALADKLARQERAAEFRISETSIVIGNYYSAAMDWVEAEYKFRLEESAE
ncbi:hypothetical protein BRX37_25495 [Sphingomonas sp. S-NIH.Pt3_0716]|nr:hypothetical protein BRX37_25495 [Sphingomonas sp. S-NIH.Pt3_0716]